VARRRFQIALQASMTFGCPGLTIWMTPPQEHMSLQLLSSAGILPMVTLALPGAHGAAVTGTHGMGVRTPNAAVVAAATVGFDGELHIPKGGMFTMGLLSMMFAAGTVAFTWFAGSTMSDDGATPKLHCNTAPMTTWAPTMISSPAA